MSVKRQDRRVPTENVLPEGLLTQDVNYILPAGEIIIFSARQPGPLCENIIERIYFWPLYQPIRRVSGHFPKSVQPLPVARKSYVLFHAATFQFRGNYTYIIA